jgi:hypothetical protein
MTELKFINEGKRVVRNFDIDRKYKEQYGRDWVFQIADGLMELCKTDAIEALILYNPQSNRFHVVKGK